MSDSFWAGLYTGIVLMTVVNIITAELRSRYKIVKREKVSDE
jgi:hypothetical protein